MREELICGVDRTFEKGSYMDSLGLEHISVSVSRLFSLDVFQNVSVLFRLVTWLDVTVLSRSTCTDVSRPSRDVHVLKTSQFFSSRDTYGRLGLVSILTYARLVYIPEKGAAPAFLEPILRIRSPRMALTYVKIAF